MRPHSGVQHVAVAACLLAPALSHGARPLVAEDASILDRGQCTVETWLERHPDDHEYWAVPHCRLGSWELEAGLGELRSGMPSGETPSWRIVGKTLFRPLRNNDWGLGVVLADQVGGGMGAFGVVAVNVPLSFSVRDDAVRVHLNAGWTRELGGRSGATWAAAAEWNVNRRLGLTFEGYGSGPAFLQAGVRYAVLSGDIVLDAAVGDRPSLSGRDRYFTLGMTINLTPNH